MGRYLDIVSSRKGNTKLTKEAVSKDDASTDTTKPNVSAFPDALTKETNLTKEGVALRDSPSDLNGLDLRFRIVAPNDADTWTLNDWLDWIDERSAILEFDGGLHRDQADSEALLMWRIYRARRRAADQELPKS